MKGMQRKRIKDIKKDTVRMGKKTEGNREREERDEKKGRECCVWRSGELQHEVRQEGNREQ